MILYEYRCDSCGLVMDSFSFRKIGQVLDECPESDCDGELVRCVSFNVAPTVEPHYNYSIGQYVTSTKDFEQKLKEGAKRQEDRTGIPHSYAPVYPSESKSHIEKVANNDTKQGESMEKLGREHNLTNPKRKIFH